MPASRMSILMTPVGSSGDVHPYVGLGRALRARGHEVTILTAGPFRPLVEGAGLRFVSTVSDEEAARVLDHPDLWHPRRGLGYILRLTAGKMRRLYQEIERLYEPGRSLLVGHTLGFAARVFEEKHEAPAVTLQLAPSAFRSDFAQPAPVPGRDVSNLPVWSKRAIWWLLDRLLIDPPIVPELNRWRAELGLAPVSRIFKEWIHSPQRVIGLFPAWFAPPQPDWPRALRLTGFLRYDEAEQVPIDAALERFMAQGEPPILFTPGSGHRQADRFFDTAVEATGRLGRRAILLTRFPEQVPRNLPAGIRHEAYAPFSWLMPRSAAIVHHGGIGTCAQGLAAGIPQLIMPMGFDQPDNVTRLWRLGVARWVTPGRFTGDRVAPVLDALVGDSGVQAACRRWADEMARGDALADTCALIEEAARSRGLVAEPLPATGS